MPTNRDGGGEEYAHRIRQFLRMLYGLKPVPMQDEEDVLSFNPKTHAEAANLIMAAAETAAALVRNGVDPKELKLAVFGPLRKLSEPFPTLHDMVILWMSEDEDPETRLEELREYNEMLAAGLYEEKK